MWRVCNLSLHDSQCSLFVCWFLSFVALMMTVMAFSFALPLHFSKKTLWVTKNIEILYCYSNYHNYPGNSLQFFLVQVHVLPFELVQLFLQRFIPWFAFFLFLGRSPIIFFCTFSSRVCFSWWLAFYPLFCFIDWNRLLFAHYQTLDYSWKQYLHWIGTWTV